VLMHEMIRLDRVVHVPNLTSKDAHLIIFEVPANMDL